MGVFAFVIACALLTEPWLIVLALSLGISLALISGVGTKRLARAFAAAFPFVAFASLSVFLFAGTNKALAMLARTSACVLPLLVMVVGTESFDLFAGLRRLGVPWVLTTLLMLTHRYVLLFSEELARMSISRRARGFKGGRSLADRYGLRVLASTAGAVLFRAGARADKVFEGLRIRGFRKDMAPWRRTQLGLSGAAFLASLVCASALLLMAQTGVVA